MKIQPISDLHLDCIRPDVRKGLLASIINPEADLVIFAGDMCEGRQIHILKEEVKGIDKPILYLAGNHEYWGKDAPGFNSWLIREMENVENVTVIEKNYFVYGDVIVMGGTLWTNLHNPNDALTAMYHMADYSHTEKLTPDWSNEQHDSLVAFITECLKLPNFKGMKKVVATHHGPSFKAVNPKYRFDATNCGFFSNLDGILEETWAPNIWIHGHSHSFLDQKIGNTRVIRNPFGYQDFGERDTGFQPGFLIDTDEITEVDGFEEFQNAWDSFENKF